MTRPHEDLYEELRAWVMAKDGLHEYEDVSEAVAWMFASVIIASAPAHPVEHFRAMVPKLEALIEEMWAQSAEETA
jgi:hypothetical protein